MIKKAKSAITPRMTLRPRYRKHTPIGPKVLGLFRVTFCVSGVALCLVRVFQGVRFGEVEAPVRAASIQVSTASPAWFAVVLLAYCVMTVMFAFLSYLFGKQLIKDFRT